MDKPLRAKARYYVTRELILLSLNLIYVKDTIQQSERFIGKLKYIGVSSGPIEVILMDLRSRSMFLKKRIKNIIENVLVNKTLAGAKDIILHLPDETTGITKRELDSGYMILEDIYEVRYILDLRTGDILPYNNTNLNFFEMRKQKLGGVYNYFKINPKDPIKVYDLQY